MPAPNATAAATQNASHSNRCSRTGMSEVMAFSSFSCSSCMVVMASAVMNCLRGGSGDEPFCSMLLLSCCCSWVFSGTERATQLEPKLHLCRCNCCLRLLPRGAAADRSWLPEHCWWWCEAEAHCCLVCTHCRCVSGACMLFIIQNK